MGFGNQAEIRRFVQHTKWHRWSEKEERGGEGEDDVDDDVEERRGRGRKGEWWEDLLFIAWWARYYADVLTMLWDGSGLKKQSDLPKVTWLVNLNLNRNSNSNLNRNLNPVLSSLQCFYSWVPHYSGHSRTSWNPALGSQLDDTSTRMVRLPCILQNDASYNLKNIY